MSLRHPVNGSVAPVTLIWFIDSLVCRHIRVVIDDVVDSIL